VRFIHSITKLIILFTIFNLVGVTLIPINYTNAAKAEALVYINGKLLAVKASTDSKGYTLIAVQPLIDSLTNQSSTFRCKSGAKKAYYNGKQIALPTACQQLNGRLYVPLRAIAEALGSTVGVQNNGSIITVSNLRKIKTKVVRTIDGDTIEIKWNNQTERIRLIGVDTPETVHPSKGEQPYGREASQYTKLVLTGKTISIEFDVTARDKYNRLLGYVYLQNGTFFNASLISQGYAQMMTYPPNVRWVMLFQQLQTTARETKRGLWALPAETTTSQNTLPSSNGCNIKGNINSKGEKIYHLPGQKFYNVTKAEQMFCSEQAAQNAGFRKSKM
jgi:micrococcal nuclease